ncbi:MAG: hypothetical protein V3T22_09635 [Planctomycetota bacterium]
MKLVIPATFFLLSFWFLYGPQPGLPCMPAAADVSAADIDPAPMRRVLSDPPTVRIGGLDQRCSNCHRLFDSSTVRQSQFMQHAHIVLDHGLNDTCVNCHDVDDRNRLALRNGETVGYAQVQLLCAQCHGTLYRDWQAGTHGRSDGYWDTRRGERVRLTCTECHDPHSPAYDPMVPLPGPNTLRMGHPSQPSDEAARANPLRKWMFVPRNEAYRDRVDGDDATGDNHEH